MSSPTIKDIEYYMSLPYSILLTPEIDGWGATIPDLPGCVGAGDTQIEALEMLEDAKRAWLSSRLAHNDPIPEPHAALRDSA